MITNHHHKVATIYKSWQPITFPWQDTNKTLPKQEGEYVFLLLILIPERHFSMHWVQDWKLLSHSNTCIKKILKGGFHGKYMNLDISVIALRNGDVSNRKV